MLSKLSTFFSSSQADYIFRDIPRGKYSPEYMNDKNIDAEKKDIVARVK